MSGIPPPIYGLPPAVAAERASLLNGFNLRPDVATQRAAALGQPNPFPEPSLIAQQRAAALAQDGSLATDPFAAQYAAEAKATRAAQMENIGLATSIAGAVSSIFGAIYSAQVGKEQAKGQARMLEHEAFMSNMNARRAERNAGAMMQQGRAAIAQMTAEAGQVKARQRTSAAARGVVIDQGSARDVTDTTEIVKEVQRVAINRQAVSRAGDARVAATNLRNQSLLSNVGAGSLRSAANRIEPLSSGGAQFISATGGFLKDRAAYMRRS